MAFLTRRDFIAQAALAPLAAAHFTSLPVFGSVRTTTAVSVKAEVGCLFPSLELLKKLSFAPHDAPFVVAHRSSGRLDRDSPVRVDLAFAFPRAHDLKHRGVLQPEEMRHVVSRIPEALKQEYGYESVDMDVASMPSFWYPFHNNAVVCCRLLVTRQGAASAAGTEGSGA